MCLWTRCDGALQFQIYTKSGDQSLALLGLRCGLEDER